MGGAASTTTLWKPPVMEAVWWRGVWVAVQTVQSSQWWCVLGCVPMIPVLTLPMASPSGLEWDTQVTHCKCKVSFHGPSTAMIVYTVQEHVQELPVV